jgi:predicted DNA-binding protein YlxM (UPF0122 family)
MQGQQQDINIPKAQRRPPAPKLSEIVENNEIRNQAIIEAYATGEYSYQQIADYFNLHFTTVGKIVRSTKK